MLSPLHLRLIELDKKKSEIKAFYEEYNSLLEAIAKDNELVKAFQDDDGTVYLLNSAEGKWVNFDKYQLDRTKRPGEERGSLSVKKAQELGFKV
jgi:hypothetical protein